MHTQLYFIWWSATEITASIFLIELDRFLAIKYPFNYSSYVTVKRSLGACVVTQIGSLVVTLGVQLASDCQSASGCQDRCRDLILFLHVIPYFVWFFLSLLCASYVVKALLNQIKRDQRVRPEND